MPELPEVQTTVDGINELTKGLLIRDVWTDLSSTSTRFTESIKNPTFFKSFTKMIVGKKIWKATRRAKNILIHLDDKKTLILIHMKMTGHIMFGNYSYNKKLNHWSPVAGQKALEDPFNRFLHLVLTFENGKHLVLSDVRKFAKVALLNTEQLEKEFAHLGPEPLDESFDKKVFLKQIIRFPNKQIKTSLMDQRLISGIGNIYSDEILFAAGVLPVHTVKSLNEKQLSAIYTYIKPVLSKGIEFGGDSTSDYRNIYGEPGKFQGKHSVYRRTGKSCMRKGCTGVIERKMIGGRSAHFCPVCQG